MDIGRVLWKSIFAPLEVFNKEKIEGRLSASMLTVILTALFGTVIAPLVYFYVNQNRYDINLQLEDMLIRLSVAIATWLVVCGLFWLFSKIFNKGLSFIQVVSIWGLSYIPNLFCVILYYLLLLVPELNGFGGISTFVIGSLFILFLVWKTIFYFIIMRYVMNTTLFEITIITIISSIIFVVLMSFGFGIGIQIPML